jgi:hypothetical protein
MLSTSDIISWINGRIAGFVPGIKAYGVGKTAARGDHTVPYVGEEYAGIDDTFKAQVYHKELSIISATVPGSGYGDDERSLQNTRQMGMVISFDESECMPVDQLYMFIQSSITGLLKANGVKSTRVSVVNANLNDPAVWRQEYGNAPYKLFGSQRLIQVNYTIVTIFDKSCITIPKCA